MSSNDSQADRAPSTYTPVHAAPLVNIQAAPADEAEDEELDTSPLFDYLGSEKGHEVISRVIAYFESNKKTVVDALTKQAAAERWFQISIIIVVIIAATTLAVMDKFSAPIGLLFGTLIGYVFGKRSGTDSK